MFNTLGIVIALAMTAGLAGAADAQAGKAAYDKACKSCHGADGTPSAAMVKALKVDMRHLGSREVQAQSDVDLKAAITAGKGKMKPVKSITGPAVDDVVAHMRTLKN
jgi:mono/diheme cytochrome c family protein